MDIVTAYRCITIDASTTECWSIATSTQLQVHVIVDGNATSSATSTVVMYGDWIFINGIIIALLAFVPLSFFISLFKRPRR